ncbi:hypothetical protein D9758_013992 [Tetrapyrgos nigripes]|uniref:Uncharacterized protein n=1 Tax=Tetrapyrgos nigripes TaxID=182062 RepID=A0A8H5LJW5_9AGAR|nr:hypothetical protein D9758_013992 [Tetrapyrgos nigripes]
MWPFNTSYQHILSLSGPKAGIQSLAFSPDGLFVSAVGYGRVTIWELQSGTPVLVPNVTYERFDPQHAYSASAWLYFKGTQKHVLTYANINGELIIRVWDSVQKQTFPEKVCQTVDCDQHKEVLSIDVSTRSVSPGSHGLIVTSTTNGVVAVWMLMANLELQNVFMADLPQEILPHTVKFSSTGQIYAFSRMGGSLLQLNGETGELMWANNKGPKAMYSVSIHEKQDLFGAWIGGNAALFKLSNSEFVRDFKGVDTLYDNAKEVAFAEEGSLIVVGSDHGPVQIFSVSSGQLLQQLEFHHLAALQYVAAQSLPNAHLIATASSTRDKPADVAVYQKKRCALKTLSQVKDDANLAFHVRITWNAIRWIGFAIIMLIALYFALFHYCHAFIFTVEASVFPLGFGWRRFIYVLALSRYSNLHYNMPVTQTIITPTESLTEYVTDYCTEFLTNAITERITDFVAEHHTEFLTDFITECITKFVAEHHTKFLTDFVTEHLTDFVTEYCTLTDVVTNQVTNFVTEYRTLTDVVTDHLSDLVTEYHTLTDVVTTIEVYTVAKKIVHMFGTFGKIADVRAIEQKSQNMAGGSKKAFD